MNWQLLAATAAMLGASAAMPAPPSEVPRAVEPVEVPETEILSLEDERYRRMTVPVTIGGQGPFRFMIDTGAQATVLSRSLAERLQLNDRETATLVGMASRERVETTALADVVLGSRNFYVQTAVLVEGAHIGAADGILGLDSLQNQRVLLDFRNKLMSVADARDLGGNRGFEIIVKARRRLGQLIIAEAMLDGIETVVIVDTGAQSSVGNPALLKRLRRGRLLGDSQLTDVNGRQLAGPVRLAEKLVVDRVQLTNFPILFADAPPFRSLGLNDQPAMILGMTELKIFRRVAIDFKTGQILFDLPRNVREFDSIFGRRLGA